MPRGWALLKLERGHAPFLTREFAILDYCFWAGLDIVSGTCHSFHCRLKS
jgi:hypothetical protein